MIKETLVSMNYCHLTDETIEEIESGGVYYCDLALYPYDFGWFIYIGDDGYDENSMPKDLLTLVKRAREAGAEWLQLDCDVPTEKDLPVYTD